MRGEPYQLPYPRKTPQQEIGIEQLVEASADKPIIVEESYQTQRTPKKNEVVEVIDDDDLLHDELKLKQFLSRFEEDLLKLLEHTSEGVKVPRPVPYPRYLHRSPDIPVTQTHATVLRRLYNDEKMVRTIPEEITKVKKFPKKPPVPKYREPEVIEVRKKSVKLPDSDSNSKLVRHVNKYNKNLEAVS